MTKRLLSILVCAGAAWTLSGLPSLAQSYDGTWRGEFACAKLSFTRGPQRVPMTVTVSGNSASYTRQVYNQDNTAVVGTEEGSGTVAGNGQLTLSAKWTSAGPNPRYTYTASYSGTITGNTANLRGTQVWKFDGKTENRSCTIALKR
jgi:hypothetical protein